MRGAPRKTRDSERLAAAATRLREQPALGPVEFRTAVAGWLDECAAVTYRLECEAARFAYPTLPCVLAILDVIHRLDDAATGPADEVGELTAETLYDLEPS